MDMPIAEFPQNAGEWLATKKAIALAVGSSRGCWQEVACDGRINTKAG
jgi:hypothetical protein